MICVPMDRHILGLAKAISFTMPVKQSGLCSEFFTEQKSQHFLRCGRDTSPLSSVFHVSHCHSRKCFLQLCPVAIGPKAFDTTAWS